VGPAPRPFVGTAPIAVTVVDDPSRQPTHAPHRSEPPENAPGNKPRTDSRGGAAAPLPSSGDAPKGK
jgi:hypothetical protein